MTVTHARFVVNVDNYGEIWAKVEETRAKLNYLEKYATYMDFIENF